MNRRTFIKAAAAASVAPSVLAGDVSTPQVSATWLYYVMCYERGQGEWVFSENTRGSFAYQREYITFDEENDLTWNGYAGFMYDGKLHFNSQDEASDFIDDHVRTKDDINIVDSIYDVYYKSDSSDLHVAHYWFNGDTGRQIQWVSDKPHIDYSKVEFA